MNISKYKLGDYITDLKCPKCKKKELRLIGIHRDKEKSHELECSNCFCTDKVNPKQVEFSYVDPEEKKKKKKGKDKEEDDIEDEEYIEESFDDED